jgi:hypothetical protein
MKNFRLLIAMALPALALGCGPSRPAPVQMQPSLYAKQLKAKVHTFVKASKENPKGVAGRSEIFLEILQDSAKRPPDENKPIYEELVQKCKDVLATARRSPGEVNKKLDEMAVVANKLPD